MIVLVGVDTLEHMVFLKAQSYKLLKNHSVDRDLRQPDKYASSDSLQAHLGVPSMLAYVADSIALLWVSV